MQVLSLAPEAQHFIENRNEDEDDREEAVNVAHCSGLSNYLD
jgi:hypothetical protein